MTNLRRFFWGCVGSGLVIVGGCLWLAMPTPTPTPTPSMLISDPDWFVDVQVVGSDGKPCLLKFRQPGRKWAAHLNSTTCPVQDANGRVVAKEGF